MKRLNNLKRGGFTLVELLMVIVIIATLGTISISVMRSSIETAKTSQTQTTIGKIDSIITSMYEKYQYRKIETPVRWKDNSYLTKEQKPLVRLWLLRDLIRFDMPESPLEVENGPVYDNQFWNYATTRSALAQNYYSYLPQLKVSENANAELLYLIVANGDPDARSMFAEREIGDTNGNGLEEFIDGWGNPIQWLRWAPELPESDRQPFYDATAADVDPNDADPLDPLDAGAKDQSQGRKGWFLAPFVVSGGPDGVIGLNMGADFCNTSPFSKTGLTIGSAIDSEDGSCHDNIHNHTLVR